jgi:hypothetical protein
MSRGEVFLALVALLIIAGGLAGMFLELQAAGR